MTSDLGSLEVFCDRWVSSKEPREEILEAMMVGGRKL